MNKKVFIYLFIIIICIFVMLVSGYKIIEWTKDNQKIKNISSQINELVTIDENDKNNVDISDIYSINSDCVGWIKIESLNIDYPLVQTTNNDFYLTNSFDKTYNKAGWIFVDYRNLLDGTDRNIVIYGHNRRDGSMFGNLKNILKDQKNIDKKDMKILLVINNKIQEYKVFSTYSIPMEEYYLTTYFDNDKEFQEYIDRAIKNSVINFKQNVSINDKILTLSTCANNNKDRVVVHAKYNY